MKFRSFILMAALTLGVLSPAVSVPIPVLAQNVGSISGKVTDGSGKALGDARITITGPNGTQIIQSAPDGTFTLGVPAGVYSVGVTAGGFQGSRNDNVVVTPGQPVTVTFSLISTSLETIGRVSGTATSINSTSAATANQSVQTFIDQGQPQVKNILDQIPGIDIERLGGSVSPGSNSSISIRGAQPYESQILIDGHPVVSSANGADGFNASFINSLLLGNVEVSKGPGSLPLTIEDAVGGTLNFVTPQITGGPTGRVLFGYDSWNSDYFGALFSDTFGKLGIAVGFAQNRQPGYLPAGYTAYGGAVSPTVTAGTAYNPHIGVLDFAYPASQRFLSNSELAKISYSFSPVTSVQFSNYATQTTLDETGSNDEYADATIVPCINTRQTPVTTCPAGNSHNNYTSAPNLGLIGTVQPINLYAPYPNTAEFDNEPIYSGEFRTQIGPGSFLARYYTGSLERIITQGIADAVDPCTTVACPDNSNFSVFPSIEANNSYDGAPYIEDTIDILHGVDAQYTLPFGSDSLTFGFDRHTDSATFGEYDPSQGPPTFPQDIVIQSLAYSLRGSFVLTPNLTFEPGLYESSTTYVGDRFDPRGGFVYRVNRDAAVRLSAGSAYVAPYYDLVNPSSYVSDGTLNLSTVNFKPETSMSYDLGSDVKFGPQDLLSADLYLTNLFNEYANVTTQTPGTYQGTPYTMVSQDGNQANVRQEGFELTFSHAPRTGIGFHTAFDLLKDYAYNQTAVGVTTNNIFGATVANNVQLPYYPFYKLRNDLFYTFPNSAQIRFSSTSYGANNSYGQGGFTLFDAAIRLPLLHTFTMNIGGTNIFNHDDYGSTAIYDGGYTYPTITGGTHYTTYQFAQPRTVYIEFERSFGRQAPSVIPNSNY